MTSAQPPSDGDRPAAGQKAAPGDAATPDAATPETVTPPAAASASKAKATPRARSAAAPKAPSGPDASGAAEPGVSRPAAKRTTTRRTPAARTPGDAETPVKRTPSTRKRSTATSISPNGEAPEILDAMLGKPTRARAADTSSSPAEPVEVAAADAATTEAATNVAATNAAATTTATTEAGTGAADATAPLDTAPTVAEAPESTPEPPETETAVLPSAADFYRERTAETEVIAPGAAGVSAEPPAVAAEAGKATSAREVPLAADETSAASGAAATATAGATSPAGADRAETTEGGARQGRSMNDLADRLDDSRFFSSLFDFTFTSYVTRKLAGPVYVVGLVLIGLGIVVGFANSLGIAIAANSPGGAFVFLLGVLVTLVAAILSVLLLRVTIEVFCAIIEIAQNTRRRRPPRD